MTTLTDRFCASAPAGEHYDDLTPGLYLLVRASTSKKKPGRLRKSWVFRPTVDGARRRIGLGRYPMIGLARARQKAMKAAQSIDEGDDPTRAGRARKQASLSLQTLTFGRARDQYLNDVAVPFKNPKDTRIRDRALKVHCAEFNDRPVTEITPREVATLLKALAPETALKTKSALNQVFSFAAVELTQRNIIMRNPVAADLLRAVGYVKPRSSARGHQPAADYREMPAIMSALIEIGTVAAHCAAFIALTASRSQPVRNARFDQIDADRNWRCPAESMKDSNHRSGAFVVPLSPAAFEIVEAMRDLNMRRANPSPFIFAGDNGDAVSETALTVLIRLLRRKGGWTDPDSGRPISVHGFRSSFRTFVETTRRQDSVIAELVMGHRAHAAVEVRYIRGDGLLDERRRLLFAWCDHCSGKSGDVIAIRRA